MHIGLLYFHWPKNPRRWLLAVAYLWLGSCLLAQVEHTRTSVKIDGNANDWSLNKTLNLRAGTSKETKVRYAMQWDKDHLYLAADVQDEMLSVNETGNDNPKLYFNDAVEIYLDSRADSKSVMDLNDYQFLVDIKGNKTVFKGNKWLLKEGAMVPKDYEGTNIVFYSATRIKGTVNDSADRDEGYFMEIAIPWSAVGIEASEGKKLKLDLCFDDVDTLSDIRSWPADFHPDALHYNSITGKNDFGFPQFWPVLTLVGRPGWMYEVQKAVTHLPILFKVLVMMLLSAMIYAIIKQYQKIQYLKDLPSKKEVGLLSPALSQEQQPQNLGADRTILLNSGGNELALKLKWYVENHLAEDITVSDLAASMHKSVRQLQRMCKAETGLSPLQFITILKLEKAGQAILKSNETIAEIAFSHGFSDPSYFGSVFKKYYGVTPLEYRNKM